jgi:hypothetical protein
MKEEIVIFLKRFGGYLVALCVISFWVWSLATGRMRTKSLNPAGDHPEQSDRTNPREAIKTDTLYFRDSTFILSKKIDTVFKTLRK